MALIGSDSEHFDSEHFDFDGWKLDSGYGNRTRFAPMSLNSACLTALDGWIPSRVQTGIPRIGLDPFRY